MTTATMPLEALLKLVPQEVIYRRTPLEPSRNAMELWRPAVGAFVKPDDEKDLWGELIYGSSELGEDTALLTAGDAERVRAMLEQNVAALRLLYEGVDRGQVRFPEIHNLDQIPADSEFIYKLGELARLPFIRFKMLAADDHFAAAAEELVRLLRIGEMICNGEGQVLHYLIGLWIRSAALRGIRRLAVHRDVAPAVLDNLLGLVQRSLDVPDGLAQSLRVDFCSISLPQLDRTVEESDLETIVDRVLDLYYAPRQGVGVPVREVRQAAAADDWLAWRREQILLLLQDHPKPFDKIATARLMGSTVAETIRDLGYAAHMGLLDFAGHLHRLRRQFRRGRLERKMRCWPVELTPGFPCEPPGRSDVEPDEEPPILGLSAVQDRVTPAELATAGDKLRHVDNPIGLILVEHLLAFDYSPFMLQHRTKLKEVRRALKKRLRK